MTAARARDQEVEPQLDSGIHLRHIPRRDPSAPGVPTLPPPDEHGENVSLIPQDVWHRRASVDKADSGATAGESEPGRASRKEKRALQGWRFGVTCCTALTTTVLLVNLTLTAWTAHHFRGSIDRGVGTAYEGSCKTVSQWSTALHVVINALSALMLSASNYTMQCLNAPTRTDIDAAHAKGCWLDVGIASVRNLSGIRSHRVILWCLLALSSIPIHLLYNSAVFKSIDANRYSLVVANEAFLTGAPYDDRDSHNVTFGYEVKTVQQEISAGAAYKNASRYERLDNSACMTAYGTAYVSGRSTVVAITSHRGNRPNETVFAEQMADAYLDNDVLPYGWICANAPGQIRYSYSCDVSSHRRNAAHWHIAGWKIDYCLSKLVPPHCKLQFSTYILTAVVLMNACKSLAMLLALLLGSEDSLVTIGDALASFLERPDETSRGRCMMSIADVHTGTGHWRSTGASQPPPITHVKTPRRRWYAAASLRRWITTLSMIFPALAGVAALLVVGIRHLADNTGPDTSPFNLGFGAVDSRAIITEYGIRRSLAASVLLSNLPQLVCSILYFAYNALLTCMLLCNEYSRYGLQTRRKPLRVTHPRGKQRSTYFLQLPCTYSLPLMAVSTFLHWVISQSIFLVLVNGENRMGYSCPPTLCTIIVGILMIAVALGLGSRSLGGNIPLARSCSAALSAACHPPEADVDAAYLPVRWGAVTTDADGDVGHCCFTSQDVHEPVHGKTYASSSSGS